VTSEGADDDREAEEERQAAQREVDREVQEHLHVRVAPAGLVEAVAAGRRGRLAAEIGAVLAEKRNVSESLKKNNGALAE